MIFYSSEKRAWKISIHISLPTNSKSPLINSHSFDLENSLIARHLIRVTVLGTITRFLSLRWLLQVREETSLTRSPLKWILTLRNMIINHIIILLHSNTRPQPIRSPLTNHKLLLKINQALTMKATNPNNCSSNRRDQVLLVTLQSLWPRISN